MPRVSQSFFPCQRSSADRPPFIQPAATSKNRVPPHHNRSPSLLLWRPICRAWRPIYRAWTALTRLCLHPSFPGPRNTLEPSKKTAAVSNCNRVCISIRFRTAISLITTRASAVPEALRENTYISVCVAISIKCPCAPVNRSFQCTSIFRFRSRVWGPVGLCVSVRSNYAPCSFPDSEFRPPGAPRRTFPNG